jgi:hypothetical protein
MTTGRTLRLGDTVLLIEHVRAYRLDLSYPSDEPLTMVWLEHMPHCFSIKGDHLDELSAAIERRA